MSINLNLPPKSGNLYAKRTDNGIQVIRAQVSANNNAICELTENYLLSLDHDAPGIVKIERPSTFFRGDEVLTSDIGTTDAKYSGVLRKLFERRLSYDTFKPVPKLEGILKYNI